MRRRKSIKAAHGISSRAAVRHLAREHTAKPVIGFISACFLDDSGKICRRLSKVEEISVFYGHNVIIEHRGLGGEHDQLPAFAAELVQRRVNVLVATGGNSSALAAKHATATIPIVFVAGDPIRTGLVQSLRWPNLLRARRSRRISEGSVVC